jgi:hypothetical protein
MEPISSKVDVEQSSSYGLDLDELVALITNLNFVVADSSYEAKLSRMNFVLGWRANAQLNAGNYNALHHRG